MNPAEYKIMAEHQKHYWWHIGKRNLIRKLHRIIFLNKKERLNVIEIGCGTGEMMNVVSSFGDITGVDISKESIFACKNKGFKNLICGDVTELDLSSHYGNYDLVLALDVLEHLQYDLDVMKKLFKLLRPGGYIFVTVPAYKFLWSTHDEALHHKRRYHSLEINTKLKDAGFNIVKSTHFVTTLFLPIAAVRFLNNFIRNTAYPKTHYFSVPKWLNNLFVMFLDIESEIIKYVRLPVGTTLLVIGSKNNE